MKPFFINNPAPEYRITAKIKTAAGKQKTVRFTGNTENMKKKMRQYFGAVEFKPIEFGYIKFSSTVPWESTEESGGTK